MKFNKSFLFAALITSSLVLTACNDKETKQTETVSTQQAQTNEAAKNDTKSEVDPLSAFNQSIKISVVSRNVVRDGDREGNAIVYSIENISDKPILGVHWAVAYSVNGQVVYGVNLPINFAQSLQPKSHINITETTFMENIPEEYRTLALDPKNDLQVSIGAVSLRFEDGSQIEVPQK